jgi:hypothetical protein
VEPDELTQQAERIAAAWYAAEGVLLDRQGDPWERLAQAIRDRHIGVARMLLENGVIVAGPEYASEGALGLTRDELRGTAR